MLKVPGSIPGQVHEKTYLFVVLSKRGNLNAALAAASDVELRHHMLEVRDKHALSAQASRDSSDNIWRRLHRAWFGEGPKPFPTNVSAIRAIAASMNNTGHLTTTLREPNGPI